MLEMASLRARRVRDNIELANAPFLVEPMNLWSRRPVEVRQLGIANAKSRLDRLSARLSYSIIVLVPGWDLVFPRMGRSSSLLSDARCMVMAEKM